MRVNFGEGEMVQALKLNNLLKIDRLLLDGFFDIRASERGVAIVA